MDNLNKSFRPDGVRAESLRSLPVKEVGRGTKRFGGIRGGIVFRVNYGIVHAAFRAGAKPTGISATSFIDLISIAETLLVCSFAT